MERRIRHIGDLGLLVEGWGLGVVRARRRVAGSGTWAAGGHRDPSPRCACVGTRRALGRKPEPAMRRV